MRSSLEDSADLRDELLLEEEVTDAERATDGPDSGVNCTGNMFVNSQRGVNFDRKVVAKGENETEL